ncbi:DNA alkylation repair protein [Enterococcus gallinarum]|nr:DNA alkylation repair protein [Enterococcus gallinarum]MDO6297328.1 DNA alkylation repair protein [Enterococcus gallinarum]
MAQENPARKVQMRAYMRNQFDFLGIPSPVRKQIQRPYFAAMKKAAIDWAFVETCWQLPYREMQYVAIDYLVTMQSVLQPDELEKISELVLQKSWWDTVDGLNKVVGGLTMTYPELSQKMLAWSKAENLWLRRIAIDHQLLRKEKTDRELLETILLNNLGSDEFFINKAIGWSLRDYAKTNPERVQAFLLTHKDQLAPLSIKEASKHL